MFNNILINYRYEYARVNYKSQETNSSLKYQKEELVK
jgi:hypothetical protein